MVYRARRRLVRQSNGSGAGWSSPVARQAHNLKVAGSNPAPATIYYDKARHQHGGFCRFGHLSNSLALDPVEDRAQLAVPCRESFPGSELGASTILSIRACESWGAICRSSFRLRAFVRATIFFVSTAVALGRCPAYPRVPHRASSSALPCARAVGPSFPLSAEPIFGKAASLSRSRLRAPQPQMKQHDQRYCFQPPCDHGKGGGQQRPSR